MGKEQLRSAMNVIGVDEEGISGGGHALECNVVRVCVSPVIGSNDRVMVVEINRHGVGREIDKTLEVGMMEEVKDGKRIKGSGETLREGREIIV